MFFATKEEEVVEETSVEDGEKSAS